MLDPMDRLVMHGSFASNLLTDPQLPEDMAGFARSLVVRIETELADRMDEVRAERDRLALRDDLESRLRLAYVERVLAGHDAAGAAAAAIIGRASG